MEKKKITLSDNIIAPHTKIEIHYGKHDAMLEVDKVKEFNKRLKKEFCRCHLVCLTNVKCEHCQFIEQEAGKELGGGE